MDPSRRSFLRGRIAPAKAAPRPPWARRPDESFVSACTRCGDCVRGCPENVLRIGDGGFPEISFATTGCTLCGDCATACLPKALDNQKSEPAFSWRVEAADTCLSWRGVECRLCGDACEARALRFRPATGGVFRLEVDVSACTGCGACLPICPVNALSLA